MTNKRPPPRPEPLGPQLRSQLHSLVHRLGESQAVCQLDISRNTLARALAGLGMRSGTRLLIEVRLEAVGQLGAGGRSGVGA